jgi:DNA-binding LacI/PurR family transcriptional regulator
MSVGRFLTPEAARESAGREFYEVIAEKKRATAIFCEERNFAAGIA